MKKSILILVLTATSLYSNNYNDVVSFNVNLFNKHKHEHEKNEKLLKLWDAITFVESNHGINIYNEYENAIGIAQIRPIMIDEVNLILKERKYSHKDAWNNELSFEIFKTYQDFVNPEYNLEKGARLWNGGRSGMNKTTTLSYYKRVKEYYKKSI